MRLFATALVTLCFTSACSKKPDPVDPSPAPTPAPTAPASNPDAAPAPTPDAAPAAPTDTAPTPTPDTAAAPTPDTAPAPTPEPDVIKTAAGVDKAAKPGKGVLASEIIDALWDGPWGVTDRPTRRQSFERAAACEKDHEAEGCGVPEGFIAAKDDKVLARIPADYGGCADGDFGDGFVVTSDGTLSPKVQLHIITDDESNHPRATYQWLQEMAAQGFTPIEPLVMAKADVEAGIRMTTTALVLGYPLSGWVLEVRPMDGGASQVALISPDNLTRYALGDIPKLDNKDCDPEARKEGMCGDFTIPGLAEAALSADKKTLFVAGYQLDGSHCGAAPSFIRAYPIEKATTLP